MRFLTISWVWVIVGCSSQVRSPAPLSAPSPVVLGKTTAAELQTQLGAPIRSYAPANRSAAEVQVFSKSESFQVEDGKVVAYFRNPETSIDNRNERSLQYWRHLWRGKNPSFEEIPETRDAHGQALYLLRETESQSAVIYDSSQGEVIRVVQYGL